MMNMNKLAFVMLLGISGMMTSCMADHKKTTDMKTVENKMNQPNSMETEKQNDGKNLNLDKKLSMCAKEPMTADGIVRLSKIEVYPQYLDKYMKYATEVGEVSLRTEPGVLTMYAVGEKENPCKITILETYASREAYERHIASEHFQKYKQGTLHMVKMLVLSDQTPLNPASRINNFIQ